MKKKMFVFVALMALAILPVVAFAQVGFTGTTSVCNVASYSGPNATLFGLVCRIGVFLNAVVPVLIALGIVYFVYGVITYVVNNDEEAKKTGRNRIIASIIGLAVIVGVWGLVTVVKNTFFDVGNSINTQLPTVPVVLPTTTTN